MHMTHNMPLRHTTFEFLFLEKASKPSRIRIGRVAVEVDGKNEVM